MSYWSFNCPECEHEHEIEVEYENSPAENVVGWSFCADVPDNCENPECSAPLPSTDTLSEKMNESMNERY